MTKGYQAETAANVAYLNYVGVLFALFFGYTLFDEVLGLASILGITLLIAGVLGANQVRERSKVSS
jgi:drug/metabolite transporter (DMT)-like permease